VFWSPIFGENSEREIEPLFHCTNPTAPDILDAFVTKVAHRIHCDGGYNQTLRALNDRMVQSYAISSVPAFYVQGVRTSLARLKRENQGEVVASVNGVHLDWPRYKELKIDEYPKYRNLALILAKDDTLDTERLIKNYRPQYIFSNNQWDQLCKIVSTDYCNGQSQSHTKPTQLYQELLALLGIDDGNSSFLISTSGKLRKLKHF
jgi:hypothetical protein